MLGRANLPAPLSPIIGRQLELGALDLLGLAERLVTLVGVGGIGKTRLAVEVASRTVGRCEHGPFFVDLAPIGNVALRPGSVRSDARCRRRTGRRRVGRSSQGARRLIGSSSSSTTVSTCCRGSLGWSPRSWRRVLIFGCWRRAVNRWASPANTSVRSIRCRFLSAPRSIDQVERSDVRCLVPGAPTDGRDDRVVESCRGCRAAAMLPPPRRDPSGVWNSLLREPHAVASGVGEATGTLGRRVAPHRADGVPARHRTMRAALDWGFELLTPPARSALQAMSVFAGSCDLAAFTAVCADGDDPPAVDVLDELVRTSFVTVETGGERNRYRLLEPVRQHLRTYSATPWTGSVDTSSTIWRWRSARPETSISWVSKRTSRSSRRAGTSVPHSTGRRNAIDAGLCVVARLHDLWRDVHIEEGLSRPSHCWSCDGGSAAARSDALYCAGFIALEMGESDRMVDLFEQALVAAQVGGHRLGEARAAAGPVRTRIPLRRHCRRPAAPRDSHRDRCR